MQNCLATTTNRRNQSIVFTCFAIWHRDNLKLKSEISINFFYIRKKNFICDLKCYLNKICQKRYFLLKKRNWKIYLRQKMSCIYLHFMLGVLMSDSITLRSCCCCCCCCKKGLSNAQRQKHRFPVPWASYLDWRI